MELVNCFESDGQWFKANLHCHTTTSDGESSLAERIEQYRGHGYAILAVTDHYETNDVAGLSREDFLVISGIELQPDAPLEPNSYFPLERNGYHLVGLNVPAGFEDPGPADANRSIEMIRQGGGEVIVAHPYWQGITYNQLLHLKGLIGLEVFNTHCSFGGKAYSSVHWDDLLGAGLVIPAVAVDDAHGACRRSLFGGWTMIRAKGLTVDAVMAAIRTGCYYASCGPVIEDFRVVDGKARVECSPAAEIHLISRGCLGETFLADDGELLTSAEREFDDSLKYVYVRAEIIDDKGRRALSNPIML